MSDSLPPAPLDPPHPVAQTGTVTATVTETATTIETAVAPSASISALAVPAPDLQANALTTALDAAVAAQQAQINAAVQSAESAVRAALATVAQAEKDMTAVGDLIPTLDPLAPASLQARVETNIKLQQNAVEAAIRQAEAAIASAVNAAAVGSGDRS